MTAILIASVCASFGFGQWVDIRDRLAEAKSTYDLEAARGLVAEISTLKASPDSIEITVEANLLLCDLARVEFERTDTESRTTRASLGDTIDESARDGLKLCEQLPESSERYRIKADFLGAMIRSPYRAKRYRSDMKEAAARAIELDPENANAYVTSSKLLIFADERHGGDLDEAVRLLHKALALDANHEPARLLLAFAYAEQEKTNEARAEYQRVLDANPNCWVAKEGLNSLAENDR